MFAYDSLLKHDAGWYTKRGSNYLERLKEYPNIDATVVSRNLVAIAQRCLRCSTNNKILCCNTSSWTNAIVGFAQMKSSVVLTILGS